MPQFADMADFPEDERIAVIGECAIKNKMTIGFVVDKEGPDGYEKADRYIQKLKARFPTIHVFGKFDGPVKDVVSVKVGPPLN